MSFQKHAFLPLVLLVGLALVTFIATAQSDQPIPLPLEPHQTRATIELLTNTSFELDANGDKIPDGWDASKTDVTTSDKLKCNKTGKVVANSGECAFQFKGNPTGETSKLMQTVPVSGIVTGSILTLSAAVDPQSGVLDSKIAQLKITLSDSSKIKLDLRLAADDGYGPLSDSAPLNLPAGVTISKVKLDFRYGETVGKYLLDDVSLTVTTSDVPTNTPPPTTPTSTPVPLPAQLLVSDGATYDQFGNSVSLSADGNTALVGAFNDDIGANISQGSAYVYVRSGATWVYQATLIASDVTAYDYFGRSVSLSMDGKLALVGADGSNVGSNTDQGSAYVFVRSGGVWTQQAKLTANDGTGSDGFGYSVSLSADSNIALVGAIRGDVGTNTEQGSAYVFVRSGGVWTQQAKLTSDNGGSYDYFGNSVSLNMMGSTALVGANGGTVSGNTDQGSAYVFVRSGTTWTQQTQLTANDGAPSDEFGSSVSLSGDGNTALVGASLDDVEATYNQGSAYVYTRSGSVWTQQAQLIASDGDDFDEFGNSVSLGAAGTTALVGAASDDVGANIDQGSAYLFEGSGSVWAQQTQLLAAGGAPLDWFGRSVSLSADVSTALIGADGDTIGENEYQGSAWALPIP